MPNLHGNDFIVYVDHTKNIMFKQRIYLNYLSKFKRFLLKPRIFIIDGSFCEDSTWQQSPNYFKISPLHCDVNSWHHANFQPFLNYFPISLFLEMKKIHLYGVPKQCFHILRCLFFLHKASTCGEDRKRYFVYHFCTIIFVLVVQI